MSPRFKLLLLSILLSAPGSFAATLMFGASAPSATSDTISSLVGAAFDADNVGGSGVNADGGSNNGAANDNTTYISSNRPAQGQTFTTGTNPGGYVLNSITVRMQGYTNNAATGGNIGSYNLGDTTSTFTLRVGKISGATFIPYTIEYAASGGTGNPGSGATANGPGSYLTFTFKAPIVLQPNTVYGFDLGTNMDYFEILGLRDGATGGNPYSAGTAYTSGANGVGGNTIATQAGDRVFQINLTAAAVAATGTFVHPGLLSTEADFERMRTKVAQGAQPWVSAYATLTSNWTGNSPNWGPAALTTVVRGGSGQNYGTFANDIAVAYGSALRWKVSGDTTYADTAVRILNSYAYTLTGVGGDPNINLLEINAYQFANVGEIMRSYSGWAPADFAAFQTMMKTLFYPMAHGFLTAHDGQDYSFMWANWDLCQMDAMYAIGVLCDDPSLTNEALSYFYNGVGEGCIDRAIYFMHPGYLGQVQESGRDQGHNSLDITALGSLCEMAWHQGVDLYGYENNRVLAGCEYVAKYNLGYDVPYTLYAQQSGFGGAAIQPGISSNSRGASRPGWDLIYNHYVNIKGLAAPWSAMFASNMRPTTYGGQDQPGFDTLTASLDPIVTGANPSGLTAVVTAQQPVLSWWGSAYATGYNVQRSTTSGGPYTTIASGLTTNTYTDASVQSGTTYYYVVTASLPGGSQTGISNEASAPVFTRLNTLLKFNETNGTSAADSTGNGWTGTLVNGATWSSGTFGNAVSLNSASSQSVTLPPGVVSNLSDFTISAWVYLNSNNWWNRIFDFGADNPTGSASQSSIPERYLFLAASPLRFAITGCGTNGEQQINAPSPLPTGQWVHVAVTLSGSVGSIYVNGQLVGQNTNMSLTPSCLPATTTNYIGKSRWSGDPYLNGKVDDFRIYRGALSAADVQDLAASGVAHLKFNETSGSTAADSIFNWNGTLANGATWTTGTLGNAVSLSSGLSQYVSLPAGIVSGLTTTTISTWVNLSSANNGSHIFDFGTGATSYMYLTPRNADTGTIRFAISNSGSAGEQRIDGNAALPVGGWHQVAVTLNGSIGSLYVDGALVGTNPSMTLTPASLGTTTQNWIGRSQSGSDPYLDGAVDDFQIYSSVLTSGQVATAYGGLATPVLTVTPGNTLDVLTWGAVPNATGYVIQRSTTPGGPYTPLAYDFTGTSFTDTGLTNGTTYYYTITAESLFGVSSASAEVSGYPVPPPPSAPTGLISVGRDGAVDLSWTASSTATSYSLKRHDTTTGTFSVVASGLTSTTYTDTSVVDGTTYTYVVSAINLGGEGANSAQSNATPITPAAQVATSVTISPLSVTLFNGSQQFSGSAFDQFGQPMQGPQPFTWSLVSGIGTMNPVGLYTAPTSGTGGTASVRVSVGGASASATVVVCRPVGVFGSSSDVGSPALSGTSTVSGTTYTLMGSGTDVWYASDQFQFAYSPLTGDGTITARVTSMTNTASWAKAGVMFRNTLDANSAYDFAFMTPTSTNGVACQYRSTAGGAAAANSNTTGVSVPYWVRLNRSGNTFTAYSSPDGVTWTQLGSALSISMNSTVYVGLAVGAVNGSALCSATFDNVSVTQPTRAIFSNDANIGNSSGNYSESGTTVTLSAQSGDVWNSSDNCHMAYQAINGDGSITARVISQTNTNATSKAGLMIRNSTAAGSVAVNNSLQPSYGVNFQGRTSANGGSSAFGTVGGIVAPYWVRLVRSGNAFSAYCSPDGSTWTQVGSPQTIGAAQTTMLFGLAACSNNTGSLLTGLFDNITVTGTLNAAPTIATQPTASVNGLSASLNVLGADDAGEGNLTYTWSVLGVPMGSVSFSDNGTNAAKSVTATFGASGMYYLQVTVTDVAGLAVSSNIIQVPAGTVTAPFAPSSLSATGTTGAVSLSWNTSSAATSYNIKRSTTSGSGYSTIGNVSSLTFTDTTVTSGSSYYYVVTAVNSVGESSNSNEVASSSLPSAPTSLTATGGNASVSLSWSAAAGATSYNILRSTSSNGTYSVIASNMPGMAYTDASVSNGTTYYYTLASVNIGGISTATSPVASALPASPKALSSPWSKADIGTVGTTGTSYYDGGSTFVVKGAGSDINGTADSLQFAYVTTASTSFSLIARVASPLTTGKVGVMIRRDATTSGAKMAGVIVQQNGSSYQAQFVYRTSTGGNLSVGTAVTGLTLPEWIRIDRASSVYTGYASADGVNWTSIGSITSSNLIGSTSYAGLAVCSRNTPSLATEVFDNVSMAGWTPPPLAPSGLIATAASQTQLNLAWSSVSGATGYQLLRSSSWSGTYAQIATPTTNSYSDTGLTAGTSYYYMVRATNSGTSGNSVVAAGSTLPYPPSAPSSLAATGSNSVVALLWTAGTGARSYNVKRSLTSGTGYTTVASGVIGTGYSDTGVSNGTAYYYVVSAVNAGGESANSSQITATPIAPPSAPSGLTATGSNSVVSLSWSAPTGATSFNIKRSGTSGSGYSTIASGITSTSFNDLSVTNGTTYYYVVSAVNAGGEGPNSSQTSATPNVLPSAPSSLTATGSNACVILSWPTATAATSYNVKRSRTSGTGYATVASGITSTSYTDGSLLNETTYYYVVTGVNSKGESGNSPQASAMPVAPPAAPTGLAATGSNAAVELSWNSSNGAAGYNVKRSITIGTGYSTIATGVASTNYSDTTVANGATYYYVVSAANAGGESANSTQVSATPTGPPTVAPGSLTATGSNASAILQWTAATGATSYNVKRSLTSGTGYTTVASAISGTTYTDTGLINGTAYYYVVSGANGGGQGPNSTETAATPVAPPGAPTGLAANPGNATVALNWTASAGATSYNVKRSNTSGSGYALVASAVATTTYTDSSVSNGTTYYYVVTALNAGGQSANSTQASASPVLPPNAPTALYLNAGNTQAALAWPSSSGATSYNVKRAVFSGGPYTIVASGSNATSYTDTGLVNGQPYYYVISAVNVGGESGNSLERSVLPNANALAAYLRFDETSGAIAPDSAGSAWNATLAGGTTWTAGKINNAANFSGTSNYASLPPGLLAGISDVTISAWVKINSTTSWQRIFDFGTGTTNFMFLSPKSGNGYLQFGITNNGWAPQQDINTNYTFPTGVWTHVAVTLSGSTGILYVNGAASGTNSAMSLRPSNLGVTTQNYIGKSQFSGDPYLNGLVDEFKIYSRALSATEIASLAAPLSAPIGVSASPGNTQVTINWNTVPGATNYNLKRASATGGPYTSITAGVTGTSYIDSGLVNGTAYYYIVTAANALAEGPYSSEVIVTPVDPPNSPSSLARAGSNTQVVLNWSASAGATGYNVKRSLVSGSNYSMIASTSGTTYTDSSANAGTTYYYVVTGTNVGGESAPSMELDITPVPVAPAGLVTTGGSGQVLLAWNASVGASGYNVYCSRATGIGYATVATGVGGTSFTDTGVADGTTYFYVVTAVNMGGESALSAESSATTYTALQNWRLANFGSINNTGIAADNADPDGDGMTNLQEFAAGADPNNASSVLKITQITFSGSNILVGFPTVAGKTYRVEYSSTLAAGSWQVVQDNLSGTGGLIQVSDLNAANQTKRFYRIIVH